MQIKNIFVIQEYHDINLIKITLQKIAGKFFTANTRPNMGYICLSIHQRKLETPGRLIVDQ